MKKYIYAVGTSVLALAMSGLPAAIAHADSFSNVGSVSGSGGVNLNADTQTSGADASTSVSAHMSASERASEHRQKKQEHQSEMASSSARAAERTQRMNERVREMFGEHLFFNLESTTTQAFSFAQLQQMIQMRKKELDQEDASTTLADRSIVKHANEVRLAVHALLAAKPLLGGIGQQVSQIAQQVDASVGTTTNAEAQIQARGFWTNFLFGGDSAAAAVIQNEVAQNQQHIQELTQLLNQANVSVDVQTTLKAQIAAMQLQQTNLANLALKEQSQWGLFSWRF